MVLTEHELDDSDILSHPWALTLMKNIKELSKHAVLMWCNKVIQLGEDSVDIDKWADIFVEHVRKTLEELLDDICNLHKTMLDKIKELLENLERLCKDLHIPMPLIDESKSLYEQQHELLKLIEEYEIKVNIRRKELNELRDEQMKLCKLLEAEPVLISETPLPSAVIMDKFRMYIEELKALKISRIEKYEQLKTEYIKLMNDLNIEATSEFERDLLSADSEIDITQTFMKQLEANHQNLVRKANIIREEIVQLRSKINVLWNMLEIEEAEREPFQPGHFPNSQEELEALKIEHKRLEELKKESIKILIDKRREELKELWVKCYCGETQKNVFHFFDSDVYGEDLLEVLDREVEKWNGYYEDCKELIMKIEKHLSLWNELLDLERSAESTDRYKNRGGKLLMEEKARNKLSKKIPEIEQNLIELADIFEIKNGHPFKTCGKTITEYLHDLHENWEEEKKTKLISKKQQRENIGVTPTRLVLPCSSASTSSLRSTPVVFKNNQPPHPDHKKEKVLKEVNCDKLKIKHPGMMPSIKITVSSPARRISVERRRRIEKGKGVAKRLPLKVSYQESKEDILANFSDRSPSECDASERDYSDKENCENTLVSSHDTFESHSYKTNVRKEACKASRTDLVKISNGKHVT